MCRWFAYIGTEKVVLEDVLVNPPHAIAEMVDHRYLPGLIQYPKDSSIDNIDANIYFNKKVLKMNHRINHDGFGMVWYPNVEEKKNAKGDVAISASQYRTELLPKTDPNFTSICINNESRCILAHVRAATSHPIVRTNNHPFNFGRHTIMHNGYITFFSKIKKPIVAEINDRILPLVYGNTDSEHLGALYLTYLTKDSPRPDLNKEYTKEEMRAALLKAIDFVLDQQRAVKLDAFDEAELEEIYRTAGDFDWANNLNVCVSDGERMVAMRCRNDSKHYPATLYYSTSSGIKLVRDFSTGPTSRQDDKSVAQEKEALKKYGPYLVISSEPTTWDEGDWTLIKRNSIIAVDLKQWKKSGKQTPGKLDDEWVHVNDIVAKVDRDVPKPEGWDEWLSEYKKKHEEPSRDGFEPPQPPPETSFKFNHTMIRVTDLKKSKQFYTQALGMEVIRTEADPSCHFLAFDQSNGKLDEKQRMEKCFDREGVLEISQYNGSLDKPVNGSNGGQAQQLPSSGPGLGHLAITLDSLARLNKYNEHFKKIGTHFKTHQIHGQPTYVTEVQDPDGFKIRFMAPAVGGAAPSAI